MRKRYLYILFLLSVGLHACLVGPKSQDEKRLQSMGSYRDVPADVDTSKLMPWWDLFQDPVLDTLIQQALDSNRNLFIAATNIEQARLTAANIKTNLYPSIGYNVNAGIAEVGSEAAKTGTALDGAAWRTLGVVNWEIDIWGKIRRSNQAALAEWLSITENQRALRVSLVAEVANLYFLLRDLDNRLSIAQRTLTSRKENTRIISDRFAYGYVAELDKLQAEQQEALAAVTIPSFTRQIVQTENAIRLLTGRFPSSVERGKKNNEQIFNPSIPVGLPSQLLKRRPDIRAATAAADAAFERIGIAEANRYPSLSLTGLLGFASPQLSTLIGGKGFVGSATAGLAGPIFQWGVNKRNVQIQRQGYEASIFQYEQTVLNAFKEVNDAIIAFQTYKQENEIRVAQVIAAQKALTLSRARYDYGYTSYLEVLVQETNLFEAELQASITRQLQLASVSNLYKALGGGW